MWLRASAVSDVGFLAGVDQAYYRHHAVNMNRKNFRSGTARGQLIDLMQRWQSFEAVFSGVGGKLEKADRLFGIARRTMATQALKRANYAYARGFSEFPVADFEALAQEIDCNVGSTKTGRAFARRKRFGMISLPLHPVWAASAFALRLEEFVRRWRRQRIGI